MDEQNKINPECLISLTWPKICASCFKGKHHYLAGRFIPIDICNEYNIDQTIYPKNYLYTKLS